MVVWDLTRITDLIDPPPGRLVLVYGPPGAGKSVFLTKLLAHNILDQNRPAIVVCSDREPEAVLEELRRVEPIFAKRAKDVKLEFVDAYRGTVGAFSKAGRYQTANCSDLSNLAITVTKLAKSIGEQDLLVILDSLTPIYLINPTNALKFVQTTLMRYAAEGRRVVFSIDEGCGKQEDIVAMMSLAAGILKLYAQDSQRILEVIKYPGTSPTKITIGSMQTKQLRCRMELTKGTENYQTHYAELKDTKIRPQLDDWIDILWIQLVLWGGMVWDPLRFPRLLYETVKDLEMHCAQNSRMLWSEEDRKVAAKVDRMDIHDPKSAFNFFPEFGHQDEGRHWHFVPMGDSSARGIFRFRKDESALSWGLANMGSPLCFYDCGVVAGELNSLDKDGCEWEVFEEKCIGMGDKSCVIVCSTEMPKQFHESFSKLTSEGATAIGQRILNEILSRASGERTIPPRPRFGDLANLAMFQEVTSVPALSDERYLMAMRMAGARVGSQIATVLSQRGLNDEAATRFLLQIYSEMKAGRLQIGETVRVFENCESAGIKIGERLCFFTTGLLNGFHTTKMNRTVKETKCSALGDRYCKWEFG